jgi:hypothetical protein
MMINEGKSMIIYQHLEDEELEAYKAFFPFTTKGIDEGLKYLGFHLKPTCYRKVDWMWLIGKLEKRLHAWSLKWLSRAGRLVLVKSVLEAIPVFWMSLAWIPKGILEKIRRICSKFLWEGNHDKSMIPWVKWSTVATPKGLRRLGTEEHFSLLKSIGSKIIMETNFHR